MLLFSFHHQEITMLLTLAVLLGSIISMSSGSQSVPLVHTPSGPIQGVNIPVLGRDVIQFRNIPFAKPPVGELRFEKPVPVEPWSDTLDGTKFGPSCIQNNKFLPEVWEQLENKEISEDCLQLNVYVPDTVSPQTKRAVMVYIHGGGFNSGSAALYDSSYFAIKDVVMVTIQYRVGLFGFLSSGDAALPGNYGLWDVIEALRWVNKNIASFGGDPDEVTVFGESAGGFCASFLSVIPSTKGLFRRVIVQSGSAAGNMFISKDPFRVTEKIGRHVGCITDTANDKEAIVKCLKGKSAQDLLNAQIDPSTLFFGGFTMEVYFWPVVDGDLLVRRPIDSLNDPRSQEFQYFQSIDLIAGNTDNEASLLPFILLHLQGPMNFNLSDGIPTTVLCGLFTPAIAKDIYEDGTVVSDLLCQRFARDNMADQAKTIAALYGDVKFVGPTVSLLDFHSKGRTKSNTYQFMFTQEIDFYFLVPTFPWSEGAGHGAECLYMFGPAGVSQQYKSLQSPEGVEFRDTIVTYWTNFAKSGDPNGPGLVPWKSYGPGGRYYMDLNYELFLRQDVFKERIQFLWGDLPKQIRQSAKTEL